jgi:uncharacterized protein (DUF1684 family)
VGTLEFSHGRAVIHVAPGVVVKAQDKPVAEQELHSDKEGKPDVLTVGSVSLYVIERGGRHAVRVKDTESAPRRAFRGLDWYPVNESYRIEARFTPYDPPKQIPIANVVGTVQPMPSPGYVTFQIGGRELRLDPVLEEPDAKELFYIFRDPTAGRRPIRPGGSCTPRCPRTARSCSISTRPIRRPAPSPPLPPAPCRPRQNRLDVRVEAGEKKPAGH